MVLLQLTPALEARLAALTPRLPLELCDRVGSHLRLEPDNALSTEQTAQDATSERGGELRTVPHELLVDLSKWARTQTDWPQQDQYRLASLLRLTDVHAPPLPERVKSPELLAILADIQLRQDRLAYSSMTSLAAPAPRSLLPLDDPHDRACSSQPPKSVAEEWTEIRRELGAIVNVAASMLAVATAVWWVGGGRSYAARLGLAMAGAVAIAAIEGFLYWRFFAALSAQRTREAQSPGAAGGVLKIQGGLPPNSAAAGRAATSEKGGGSLRARGQDRRKPGGRAQSAVGSR
ncbi:hypothetical protein JCM8202_001812 [Rhodotorula sphaerocarpa]